MDLEIGDVIQDNDKREKGRRQLVIVGWEGPYVFACRRYDTAVRPRRFRIRRDRIADHFRSFGFTRIAHDAALAVGRGET
jgi:hypothetical protein